MENGSFRTVSFGGFNKDDVMEHLEKLNFELKEAKVSNETQNKRLQKEINEKTSQIEKLTEEKDELLSQNQILLAKIKQFEQENESLSEAVRLKANTVEEVPAPTLEPAAQLFEMPLQPLQPLEPIQPVKPDNSEELSRLLNRIQELEADQVKLQDFDKIQEKVEELEAKNAKFAQTVEELESENSRLDAKARKACEDLEEASRDKTDYNDVKETIIKMELDAHLRAKKLKDDAEIHAEEVLSKANFQAENIVRNARNEVVYITAERDELVSKAKANIESVLQIASTKFEKIQQEIMSVHELSTGVKDDLGSFSQKVNNLFDTGNSGITGE